MTAASASRRVFLLGATGFLLAFDQVPVRFEIENGTTQTIHVRLDSDRPWEEIPAGKTARLATFPHSGLCSPPERWLPESFTGLDVQLDGGRVKRIDRRNFEEHGAWGRGPSWKLSLTEDQLAP